MLSGLLLTIDIMKGTLLVIVVFLMGVYHLDAFLSNPYPRTRHAVRDTTAQRQQPSSSSTTTPQNGSTRLQKQATSVRTTRVVSSLALSEQSASSSSSSSQSLLTHEDIQWKLRPPPETPFWRKAVTRLSANLIRLDCIRQGTDPPFCLCPKGGQAVLEAYYENQKVGRFGISTVRGPPAPPIDESAATLFQLDTVVSVGTAAIVYMFVEPAFRKRGIGELALGVISVIHALQGCDFTVLVADDDGSGRLVDWYERHGFKRAPKLQAMMGSPNGEYGTTMIGPTKQQLDYSCRLQWW